MAEISLKKLVAGGVGPTEIDVNFNNELQGQADATIPLNVDLTDGLAPVVPISLGLVGNTLTIEVPSGGADTPESDIDRFGNVLLPTKPSERPTNYTMRALDWADEYFNALIAPPSGAIITDLMTEIDNLETSGIWSKGRLINIMASSNATDILLNTKYPYNAPSAQLLRTIGSPTIDANGFTLNGSSQILATRFFINQLPFRERQISWYQRQALGTVSGLHMTIGGMRVHFARFTDSKVFTGLDQNVYSSEVVTAAETQKLQTLRRSGTVGKYTIQGVDKITLPIGSELEFEGEIMFGGQRVAGGLEFTNSSFAALNLCYIYAGLPLTDSEEVNHATIIQAIQTILSRNV